MKFEFNDCNVCINPEVIYSTEDTPYKLAWNYFKLTVATDGNKWDYEHRYGGGGGPCMPIHGKYDSRQKAIEEGLDHLWASATTILNTGDGGLGKCIFKPAQDYLDWYKKRGSEQLSLF